MSIFVTVFINDTLFSVITLEIGLLRKEIIYLIMSSFSVHYAVYMNLYSGSSSIAELKSVLYVFVTSKCTFMILSYSPLYLSFIHLIGHVKYKHFDTNTSNSIYRYPSKHNFTIESVLETRRKVIKLYN